MVTPTINDVWICPTCGATAANAYCGACGEKRLGHHDLTLLGIFEHAVESLFHVDGRLFRSLRTLLLSPGTLTAAYLRGRRKAYFAPFQVFLVANVIFFVVQSALGFQTLSNDLASHIGNAGAANQFYSATARGLADHRLADTGRTIDAYSEVFNHAVRINAKALAVVMVPAYALLALITFPRARHPLLTAVVFSLHFVAFFLLMQALMMPIIGMPLNWILRAVAARRLWDPVYTLALEAIWLWWSYSAFQRVYGASRVHTGIGAAVVILASIPVVIGYRFIVFVFTLYTT